MFVSLVPLFLTQKLETLSGIHSFRKGQDEVMYSATKSSDLHKLLMNTCSLQECFLIQLVQEHANRQIMLKLRAYMGVYSKDGREPKKFLNYTSILRRLYKLLSLWTWAQCNHIMISGHETTALMV